MEDWEVKAALLLKERDNKPQESTSTGLVVNPSPLMISLGDEIILDEEDLIISNRVYEMVLKINDQVILLPAANGQQYYAIDKVGK